jgi:hypothetical protein
MEYLTELFAQPGLEIAAVALASGHALACRGTPSEPLLDVRATAEYRCRIEELDREIDDADACADIERAAMARAELDRLVEELLHTTGLAGGSRTFTDDAERARVSVHKAIKRALRMIADADASLGHELSSRVVTGMRCVYRGEP